MRRSIALATAVLASASPTSAGTFADQVCSYVYWNVEDKNPESSYVSRASALIIERAGVNEGRDNDEIVRRKVASLWARDPIMCNTTEFKGPITHYAVLALNSDFLQDYLDRWMLDPSAVNPADGLTILGYVEAQLKKNRGTPAEAKLAVMRKLVIKADGK